MSQKQRSQPFIHPFTFFLVDDGLSSIFDMIKVRRFGDAVQWLYWLTGFLDRKMQEQLEKEIARLEDTMDDDNLLTRDRFRELLVKVMQALHQEGYFIAAKRGPPTRERTLEDVRVAADVAKFGKH